MKFILIAAAALSLAVPAVAEPLPATKSGTIPDVTPNKGRVVFYRPGSMMGMALGCTVREGPQDAEIQVARLGNGKYWVEMAEPGKHAYRTEGEKTDILNLEVEPGETYFVKCKIGMGIMAGRANISPSDAAEFSGKAKGLKLWDAKPGEAGKVTVAKK